MQQRNLVILSEREYRDGSCSNAHYYRADTVLVNLGCGLYKVVKSRYKTSGRVVRIEEV